MAAPVTATGGRAPRRALFGTLSLILRALIGQGNRSSVARELRNHFCYWYFASIFRAGRCGSGDADAGGCGVCRKMSTDIQIGPTGQKLLLRRRHVSNRRRRRPGCC
jgi:hypothetical protein